MKKYHDGNIARWKKFINKHSGNKQLGTLSTVTQKHRTIRLHYTIKAYDKNIDRQMQPR